MSDIVNHPDHYINSDGRECIDIMTDIYGPEAVRHFCLCNAIKYEFRKDKKGDPETDIRKAEWYRNKAIEIGQNVDKNKRVMSDISKHAYDISRITDIVSCYSQLAEECCECAQAALKMVRKLSHPLTVPKTVEDIVANLNEEVSDVLACMYVLQLYGDYDIILSKLNRWKNRIERAKKEDEDARNSDNHFGE